MSGERAYGGSDARSLSNRNQHAGSPYQRVGGYDVIGAVIDDLFAILQMCLALGSAFGPAIVGIGSAVGGDDLRWGFLCLIVPLLVGAAIVSGARKTYRADADRVLRPAGGPAA